ncbi:MAG TPA: NAD(P)-dependent oxidoreductase [Candidatus Binatia bacterium]
MKAFLTASFDAASLARLEKLMPVHVEDWRVTKNLFFDGAQFAKRIREEGCDVVIVEADLVHRDVLDAVDLKIIGACRGEPVNVDIALATERGIPVFHTPARNADAVADLTLCFMLTLARHVYDAVSFVKNGENRFGDASDFLKMYEAMTGVELYGRTVGLIGFGAIGQRVARRVLAFGARVLAYDPFVPDEAFERIGAARGELDDVLRAADFLSLHVPDVPQTKGMLGERELGLLKEGVYFVNTARAAAVEEEPLYQALASKRIRAAALDVFWNEPVQPDNRFVKLPNVIATPHIGGATVDVIAHQGEMMCQSIEAYLRGEEPPYIANPEVLASARRR